jgi:hypothetical protein
LALTQLIGELATVAAILRETVAFAVAIGLCGNAMSSENHSTTLYLQRVMRGGVLIDKPRTAIARKSAA